MTVAEATDPSAAPVLVADHLSKRYGRREVVGDVSFTVYRGQVCALLGPNGAGKTSTMRMLVGLSRPDRGTATILGSSVGLGAPVLRRVGVLIDGPAFIPHLSGLRNLKLLWTSSGRDWPPPALTSALDLAGLDGALNRKVKNYSMGMKQRLILAQALMGGPELLILDEPANGLDPAEVRALRRTLGQLTRTGAAVLISSHQLAEVQQLATHAVVLNHGRLVASQALADVVGEHGQYQFQVDDPVAAAELLNAHPGVTSVAVLGSTVTASAPDVASRVLTRALVSAGIGVESVRRSERTLEDAFLAMTEEDPRP